MFNKKMSAVLLATAMTLGTVSAASADAGHIPGVPPQLSTVLSSLVTKGTITQAQADAITAALAAAVPTPNASGAPSIGGFAGRGKDGGQRGGFGEGFGMNSAARQAIITSTLGITSADLQAARQAGKSLATIAGTKTAALITALVNYDSTQIDAAVTAGKLTSAQATTMKAGLTAHVTQEVNNVGRGPDRYHGMGGAAPKIPTPGASTTSYKKASVKKA
jgi:hypothetical protein